MKWSLKIAKIAGIEVKIHITFFLLLAWLGLSSYRVGGMSAALDSVLFVCLVFVCVVLHEFGHAIAARRYGVRTPDITLLPIGGVARMDRMPDKPAQEVVVALAGPMVNVIIAAVLFLVLLPGGGWQAITPPSEHGGSHILSRLLWVNIALVIFNMIPAFPMDGGRVLRSLLAMRMNHARATQIAANIGQALAFGFGFAGLFSNPLLILIAVFIYFGAASEASLAQMKDVSRGLPVAAAMVTDFQSLPETATLDDAIESLLATSQHDFPVVNAAGEVRGILTRRDLIAAVRKTGVETPVIEVMRTGIPTVQAGMSFERAFTMMQECECPALPVLNSEGRLTGLFTPENVGEMMMIQSALGGRPSHARHLAWKR